MIWPRVTLRTAGHPVELDERYDFITHAPIVIEDDVWIGAAATIAPGVTIGRGSVVGAGAVVAKDVPPMSAVTGTSVVERRRLKPTSDSLLLSRLCGCRQKIMEALHAHRVLFFHEEKSFQDLLQRVLIPRQE